MTGLNEWRAASPRAALSSASGMHSTISLADERGYIFLWLRNLDHTCEPFAGSSTATDPPPRHHRLAVRSLVFFLRFSRSPARARCEENGGREASATASALTD